MKKNLKKKKGLTLLELVIVLGLMGIVTTLIFSFVNITQRKSKELDIRQELQFEGTMITESMMGNVLEMKSISAVDGYTIGTDDGKITSIIFDLAGAGTYKNTLYDNILKMEYRLVGKNLELWAHHTKNTSETTSPATGVYKIDTVSEYVKGISIENKAIKEFIKTGTGASGSGTDFDNKLKLELEKEKSVNLNIVLEDDYYNEKIEHTHTIELSLRNAR